MRTKRGSGSEGYVLLITIAAIIIISFTAVLVMNLTFARFREAAFRADRAKALYAAEHAVQYAFERLKKDTTWDDPNPTFPTTPPVNPPPGGGPSNGLAKHIWWVFYNRLTMPFYVLTSVQAGNVTIDGVSVVPDIRDNNLFSGEVSTRQGKEVTLWIQYIPTLPDPPNDSEPSDPATATFKIRVFTDYGQATEGF